MKRQYLEEVSAVVYDLGNVLHSKFKNIPPQRYCISIDLLLKACLNVFLVEIEISCFSNFAGQETKGHRLYCSCR